MKSKPMTIGKKLVAARRIASLILLILMTVGFISSASAAVVCSEMTIHAQIVPMILLGSFTGIVLWAGATLVFGRIYCSTICPIGTLQDLAARLWRCTPKRSFKYRYRYSSTQAPMQLSWTGIVAFMAIMSQPLLLIAFDPCSLFSSFLQIIFGQRLSLVDASTIIRGVSIGVMATLVVVIPIIIVGAFRGRTFCNTFCPVGGALSALSRVAVLKVDINTDLCIHCNRCVDVCKARCINPDDSVVDTPRCVVCFNCVKVCPNDAITYTARRHRLSTPMMMSTSTNMKISKTENETISSATQQNNDRRDR